MPHSPIFHLLCDVPHLDPSMTLEPVLDRLCGEERPRLYRYPTIQAEAQLQRTFVAAQADGGIVVHSLVADDLRLRASTLSRLMNVPAIDLVGPMIARLTDLMGISPHKRPGLYHEMTEEYFRRIEAIEFAVAHDDGLRPSELDRAEIILTGVSRTSKTPLSMYLATHGWLVANVPLVDGIAPPQTLFGVDRRKVFGLAIRPDRLVLLRQVRLTRLGMTASHDYAEFSVIQRELAFARQIHARGGWEVIDVTSKSIEESAAEILSLHQQNFAAVE
ncbi:MAG: kinase/pyrophosphorylase [Chloroflexi bacterium]|jgi:regulator of PEP synthase PpsR (kinase-PPPase family)|nr:kinase/pyrophosphorylase [Chloroflexota bacterium]